jgi:hypothetical protein
MKPNIVSKILITRSAEATEKQRSIWAQVISSRQQRLQVMQLEELVQQCAQSRKFHNCKAATCHASRSPGSAATVAGTCSAAHFEEDA